MQGPRLGRFALPFIKPGPFAQHGLQQCGGRGPKLLSDSSRTQSPRGVSSCLAFGQDEWVVRHRLSTALCASRFSCLWLEICVVFTSCRYVDINALVTYVSRPLSNSFHAYTATNECFQQARPSGGRPATSERAKRAGSRGRALRSRGEARSACLFSA